jgi:predicted DNA-binding transcriptional regulator AlpA
MRTIYVGDITKSFTPEHQMSIPDVVTERPHKPSKNRVRVKPVPSEPSPRLLDCRSAARLYAISESTFLRNADAGLIPRGIKLGGRRLWRIEELEAHIQGGCKPVR